MAELQISIIALLHTDVNELIHCHKSLLLNYFNAYNYSL